MEVNSLTHLRKGHYDSELGTGNTINNNNNNKKTPRGLTQEVHDLLQ
jgi:hypothetical protein